MPIDQILCGTRLDLYVFGEANAKFIFDPLSFVQELF